MVTNAHHTTACGHPPYVGTTVLCRGIPFPIPHLFKVTTARQNANTLERVDINLGVAERPALHCTGMYQCTLTAEGVFGGPYETRPFAGAQMAKNGYCTMYLFLYTRVQFWLPAWKTDQFPRSLSHTHTHAHIYNRQLSLTHFLPRSMRIGGEE